jgi:hypothetical protein
VNRVSLLILVIWVIACVIWPGVAIGNWRVRAKAKAKARNWEAKKAFLQSLGGSAYFDAKAAEEIRLRNLSREADRIAQEADRAAIRIAIEGKEGPYREPARVSVTSDDEIAPRKQRS